MSEFGWPVRVYWEDTDGGGIVYYANYLRFLERSRTEWLRSLGFSQQQMAREPGVLFMVVNLSVDYRRPARLDDELLVTSAAQADGAVCMRFAQRILRGVEPVPLLTAEVRVACVDARTLRPRKLPQPLCRALTFPMERAFSS
jgi:acyl-CoA thioester hydrolase